MVSQVSCNKIPYVDTNQRTFLIQVFLCFLAIVALALFLHLPKRQSETPIRKQLPRIDFVGAILLVLTVTGLLYGLNRGSNVSWRSPLTIASLCATIPLSLAFLTIETRFAVESFTPGHIIFSKALFVCYIQNLFAYAAFTSFIFYLPLFFQVRLGMTPTQAGAGLIPAGIFVVIGTVLGGVIIKKTGKFYWLTVLAAAAATLGCIPLIVAPSLKHGSLISIFIGSVIGFLPQGMTITASLIAISRSQNSEWIERAKIGLVSNVSAADQAVATACAFLFRSLGAASGVSLVGVLIQHVLRTRLYASLEPREARQMIQGLAQSLDYIKDLPPSLQTTVRDCYGDGIQAGFAMCIAMLAIGTVSTFWWREKKL